MLAIIHALRKCRIQNYYRLQFIKTTKIIKITHVDGFCRSNSLGIVGHNFFETNLILKQKQNQKITQIRNDKLRNGVAYRKIGNGNMLAFYV